MDPTNPQWGWSWLERWMVPNTSETIKSKPEKDLNGDPLSTKGMSAGKIAKCFARHQLNTQNNPPSHASQKLPSSTHPSPSSMPARKIKIGISEQGLTNHDDDSKSSTLGVQSDRYRRNTMHGSSMDDAESMGSSSSVPSYMATTHSAKAKLKIQSPLGVENRRSWEKPSAFLHKKRLSFPPPSRPQKVEA